MLGLEKIREESLNPLKQGLIGSRVKPEPSLKQCPSLGIITCSCIITVAMITDMRSPDVIFGKGWEMFLLLIMQLTLERETSDRNTGGEKPPRNTAELQPSPWKYNQSQNPALRKGTRMSNTILPSCCTPGLWSDHPSQHHSRQGCWENEDQTGF